MRCDKELRLTGMAGSEAMLQGRWYAVPVQMFMVMVTDDVLQKLAADTGERNGAIVLSILSVSFLEDTCAFFQSSGRTTSRIECWKMLVRIGANSGAASFTIRQGMLSGPVALFALMLLRGFWTPLMFTWMLPIGGKLGPYGVVMSEDFSLVKTDLNWLFRISDLDRPSANNFPWDFSVATPMFSPRLKQMNFQKGLEGWFCYVVHIIWLGLPRLLCKAFLTGLVPWPCFVVFLLLCFVEQSLFLPSQANQGPVHPWYTVSCGGHITWDAGVHDVGELFLKGIRLGDDVKFAHGVEIIRTEVTDLLKNFCPVGFRKKMDLSG